MNPLSFLTREGRRAMHDAAAPVAPTLGAVGFGQPVVIEPPDLVTLHPGSSLNEPMTISLAAMRGCVGDHELLRRSPEEDAAIIERVLVRLTAGRQVTARGMARVREDLREGLRQAGLT